MIIIKVKITDGEIAPVGFANEQKFKRFLKSAPLGIHTLEIREEAKPKSQLQDNLYKKIILTGIEISGDTYSSFHNDLIQSFSPIRYTTDLLGKKVAERLPYEEMTKPEASRYLEKCVFHMKEFFEINIL